MKKQIKLLPILLFSIGLLICAPCRLKSQSVITPYLRKPKLIDYRKFKQELPGDSLKVLNNYMQSIGSKFPPLLKYVFLIDTLGKVVNGQLIGPYDGLTNFFKSYAENLFNTYKWQPALLVNNKQEKIRSMATLLITVNDQRDKFEVVINLVGLPDEKSERIYMSVQKDIIYNARISYSEYSDKHRRKHPK